MVAKANDSELMMHLEKIKRQARQIRAEWTPEQREYRARLARQKIAALAFLFDAAHGVH